MLKISLNYFRCWENLVIEIPLGSVTLIKGSSGRGKTTLLQAITWGLYGNIRLVTPNHIEKAKTRVIIEILNTNKSPTIIDRRKNPNRLLLTYEDKTYEDKVAQSIIDNIFGIYDIWLASCYVGQGYRNSFLTAPNTGKMELLNNIAFHEEDPTTYIERIDACIMETEADYKLKLASFDNNLKNLNMLMSTTDISKALTNEQIESINNEITNAIDKRNKLQLIKTQRDIDVGIVENLKKQLLQITNTNIKITTPDDILISLNTKYEGSSLSTLNDINTIIENVMNIIPVLQRRDDLHNEVKKYDSLLLPYVNFTDNTHYTISDYQETLSKETIIRDNQKLSQNLNVLYSEKSIHEKIQEYKNIIEAQDRLKLEQENESLKLHIIALEKEHVHQTTPLIFPDDTPQEICIPDYSKYSTITLSQSLSELSERHGALQSHIAHLQKGQGVLECPHCKGPIRYQQGILIPADSSPTNDNEILENQKQLRNISMDISKIQEKIKSLMEGESLARINYENAINSERKRIDIIKQKIQQLELEKQRRDLSNQARAKQITELKEKYQSMIEVINEMPQVFGSRQILSSKELESVHSLIARLNSIVIISSPVISSSHIQSCINYQNIMQKYNESLTNYNEYLKNISPVFKNEAIRNIQIYIERLRTYYNLIKDSSEEKIRIDKLKETLNEQINIISMKIISDPTSEIDIINKNISELQQLLIISTKAHDVLNFHVKVTKEREIIVDINNTISDLQVFRQYAVDTECKILQQIVESINASIENVCGTLFDKDINITLSLFKTYKTTKNIKPVVNFAISYQGGIFDNISQMSGGEGDRASLALTLALNRLSSCPILMLDESLASLDIDMKEAAIRTIRENTNNTVLIIMHDGVEGVFSHCINLDEIKEGRY